MYLIEQIIVLIVGGFLSVSGLAAQYIDNSLRSAGLMPPYVAGDPAIVVPNNDADQQERVPHKLPSHFGATSPLPRILIENQDYQEAATIGAVGAKPSAAVQNVTAEAQNALVNILCSYRESEDRLRVTTGSGVFIDNRGIILTNAHVAQFLLLEAAQNERRARCTIRTGSPATAAYVAELLYISPAWIRENANLIDAEHPSGTGERDYALLYISESLHGDMPTSFPALPVNVSPLSQNDGGADILVGGYPAEIFREDGPRAELVPKVATTSVTELYTFTANHADLIAIGSSSVGEQGSSGGPVMRPDGSIIGLIVTRGNDEDGPTSLRAITLSYINNTIKEETGFDLLQTLTGDPAYRADVFNDALTPFLSGLLSQEL